jgi:uncharacterized protein with LGFP repeats
MMSAISDKHAQLSWIGNPKDEGAGSNEGPLPDGRGHVQDFDNGSIYWSPETGAHEVHGAIRDKYGQTRKWIGYPTTDETGCPDGVGRFNHFEHGSIYWTPETGAHEVHGAIRDKWQELGWERSKLRYPTSDEHDISGGRASNFQGGEIQWTQTGGPVVRKSQRLDD